MFPFFFHRCFENPNHRLPARHLCLTDDEGERRTAKDQTSIRPIFGWRNRRDLRRAFLLWKKFLSAFGNEMKFTQRAFLYVLPTVAILITIPKKHPVILRFSRCFFMVCFLGSGFTAPQEVLTGFLKGITKIHFHWKSARHHFEKW